MGFLRRLFGAGQAAGDEPSDGLALVDDDRHSVTAWIRLDDPGFETEREQVRLFALEDRLMRVLDTSGVGEHDTNDLEHGFLGIRLLGDDADAVLAVIRPLLVDVPPGSYLAVRRGPPGTGEDRIDLDGPRPAAERPGPAV